MQERVVGPYGERFTCPDTGESKVRLTTEGRAILADWMAKYPHPIALLMKVWGPLYRTVRQRGFTDEEIDSACMLGMVRTMIRFDPSRAKLSTALSWGIRGTVADLLRVADRSGKELPASSLWGRTRGQSHYLPEPAVRRTDDPDYSEWAEWVKNEAQLSIRERKVFEATWESVDFKEIGKALKLGKPKLAALRKSALRKLRLSLDKPASIQARDEATVSNRILSMLEDSKGLTGAKIRERTAYFRYMVNGILERLVNEGKVELFTRRKMMFAGPFQRWVELSLYRLSKASRKEHLLESLGGNKHDPHGRGRVGELNHNAKLTTKDVEEIRDRVSRGETQSAVARDKSISRDVVSRIVRRESWKGVA